MNFTYSPYSVANRMEAKGTYRTAYIGFQDTYHFSSNEEEGSVLGSKSI